MKQLLQNLKTGETYLEEVPVPVVRPGSVLVRTHRTLVSLGTERMLVEFGRANLFSKARQQPEKVRVVLDKMKADGILPTLEAVFNQLDQPLPLGYCQAGEIIALGRGLEGGDLQVGDRVATNGPHAEVVSVPRNLVAKIPTCVSFDEAAFTVVASIGLQGIRLAQPTLGETVVVTGLGLIGLLTAQLAVVSGCRVIGMDFDERKVELARRRGVEAITLTPQDDPVELVMEATGGVGADAVLITASAKSDAIVSQAARMSRKRGRIILVGVVGLQLNRAEFYEKELSFQVSCSYGPGRYDDSYEQGGQDYPLHFVRWTENRNFQAVLNAMAAGRLDVKPLISEIVDFDSFGEIYGQLGGQGKIASILRYSGEPEIVRTIWNHSAAFTPSPGSLAIVGAGNFTKMTLLPALKKAGVPVKYIVSAGGVSGTALARKHGIAASTTELTEVLEDPCVSGVIITTRHNSHARMALETLRAGKHVLVEKPICLTRAELAEIDAFYAGGGNLPSLSVGFNRRFSPHTCRIKKLLGDDPGMMNVVATFNAGAIPHEHWVHDPTVGGGRLLGEACHFIDLISFLVGSRITAVCASGMGTSLSASCDSASVSLRFENGSHGVVHYFANGHKSCSKERVEVFSRGRNIVLDNFRVLQAYGFKGFTRMKTGQDKGHRHQFQTFARRVREGGPALIPLGEILNTGEASLAAVESLVTGQWIPVPQGNPDSTAAPMSEDRLRDSLPCRNAGSP